MTIAHATREGPPLIVEEQDHGTPQHDRPADENRFSFSEMAKDYEFFTSALLTSHGGFDRDPVVEFGQHNPACGADGFPQAIDVIDDKFFQGIGCHSLLGEPVDWDRRIYAIIRERWNLCRDFISGISWCDQSRKFYGRVNFYEIQLLDLGKVKRGGVIAAPPLFTVTVFGATTTDGFYYLSPPASVGDFPFLVVEPPRADLLLESQAIVGTELNPLAVRRNMLKGPS